MSFHTLPICVLGSGRTSLCDKFVAVVHAMMLQAGGDSQSLVKYMKEARIFTTDFGVEYGLPSVLPATLRDVLPELLRKAPLAAVGPRG